MTSTEFAPYLWHDNVVHAFRLDLAHPELNHWRSELVLDIDHIVNWRCSADGSAQFLVTPATLTFHDAADLCISLDCGDTGGQVALHDLSIDHIGRTPIEDQSMF